MTLIGQISWSSFVLLPTLTETLLLTNLSYSTATDCNIWRAFHFKNHSSIQQLCCRTHSYTQLFHLNSSNVTNIYCENEIIKWLTLPFHAASADCRHLINVNTSQQTQSPDVEFRQSKITTNKQIKKPIKLIFLGHFTWSPILNHWFNLEWRQCVYVIPIT